MSFKEQVNAAVDTMKQDDSGNWQLPTDSELSEEVTYAATLEKRRRDTQSEFSRGQQALKVVEAENKKLTEGWAQETKLTTEQVAELDELKHTDPDGWRNKIDEYEGEARSRFAETRETITQEARVESETDYRTRVMAEFDEANPEISLTDEVITNDLPPRYLKSLEAGETTFDEFLVQAKDYLTKGKVMKTEPEVEELSLGKASGSSTPESRAVDEDARTSYKNETY
ncbi:MAG: hypothetical protein DRP93_08800 [Candidatus Neomarinimicrobiota bacterium]|nr:MAG: hypothetical protein DRP93_08800 [Candidatus Neomarinimicrobiota bacterium]